LIVQLPLEIRREIRIFFVIARESKVLSSPLLCG
jgi:hypothetical protein